MVTDVLEIYPDVGIVDLGVYPACSFYCKHPFFSRHLGKGLAEGDKDVRVVGFHIFGADNLEVSYGRDDSLEP